MNCADFEVLFSDYVDGTVSVEDRRAVESHADQCETCRELLRDVFQAVSFLDRVEDVTAPPELITRIVYQAPQGKLRSEAEQRGFFSRTFSAWLQPVLQPRFAMGMAMTILSFAMLGRCTGVQLQQIRRRTSALLRYGAAGKTRYTEAGTAPLSITRISAWCMRSRPG